MELHIAQSFTNGARHLMKRSKKECQPSELMKLVLPQERLFHCGDVKALARLLEAEYRGTLPRCTIGEWTAKSAAKRLMKLS